MILVARLEGLLQLELSLDPEEFHETCADFQQRVRDIGASLGGETDRRVGANVLTVFGAAASRGNEAERGVRAALALRDAILNSSWRLPQGVHLRIGISQGQILHSAQLFPLTGLATHSAHALAAGAPDEAILIDDATRQALIARVDVQPVGRISDIVAWRLNDLHPQASQDAQPFVGRRPELGMLLATLERCRSSRRGRAVVVRGEPGIGKTRLVSRLRSAARETNVDVHSVNVFDFGQALGNRPVTALALSLLGLNSESPPAERATAVAKAAATLRASVDQLIYLSDLVGAPLTEELAALEKAMEPAARQRGRSLALSLLLESAAQRAPLLILIEDVHWADQDEIARFAEIAATVAHCPALLLLTSRVQDDPINPVWRSRARGCPLTIVDLAPLAADEAEELAALYPIAPDLTEVCIQRAEGNPLFLDQLLRAAAAGEANLPGSIRTLILSRAERLATSDRDALQAAAVLGHRCTLAALHHLIDDDAYSPAALEEAGLMRTEGAELAFAHALFRDASYESILRSRRRELHGKAAAWFARQDLALRAEHLAAANDVDAATAFLAAAQSEQAQLRFEQALVLARKGAALAREPAHLYRLNCLLGELLLTLGRTHDALTAYREAIDFSSDHAAQVDAWVGIASTLRVMDRLPEALEALQRAQTSLGDSGDALMQARIATLHGNLCFPLGRVEECLQSHERALDYARRAASPNELARAYSGLGDAWFLSGHIRTARDYFFRCIEEAQRHNLPGVRLANLPMVAVTSIYCAEIDVANQHLEQALQLAHHISDARSELLVKLVSTTTLLYQGRLADTERAAQQTLDMARSLGARRFQAEALSLAATSLLMRGEREQAASIIEEGLELGRSTGMNYCGPTLLGIVARATHDARRRQAALHEGEELLAAGCVSHTYFEFCYHAIELCLQEKQWQEALRYADLLAAYTRREPLGWTDLVIARGRLLAEVGLNAAPVGAIDRLLGLKASVTSLNLGLFLPAIDEAITTSQARV